jgi:uncharacterized membrane protein
MRRFAPSASVHFGLTMLALGALGLLFRDFALIWGEVPAWVPAQPILACVAALVALAIGAGLLVERTRRAAARAFFVYVTAWWLLLKVPLVFVSPGAEVSWLDCGMRAILVAGAAVLYGREGLPRWWLGGGAMPAIRRFLGLALLPVGISHFVYVSFTTPLIPDWIPFHLFWACVTGACHLAAGLGLLFGVLPRLAARLEAVMLGLFTLIVWVPALVTGPGKQSNWTEFWVSWTLTVAVAVVAAAIPARPRASV